MDTFQMTQIRLRAGFVAVFLAVVWSKPLLAQDEPLVTLDFREDTDILEVVEMVAEVMGRTIIVEPRARVGTIRLYDSEPMTADQVWQLFLQILQVNQLTAVESSVSGVWQVDAAEDVRLGDSDDDVAVQEDWRPFEFDGQTFFFIPLG